MAKGRPTSLDFYKEYDAWKRLPVVEDIMKDFVGKESEGLDMNGSHRQLYYKVIPQRDPGMGIHYCIGDMHYEARRVGDKCRGAICFTPMSESPFQEGRVDYGAISAAMDNFLGLAVGKYSHLK